MTTPAPARSPAPPRRPRARRLAAVLLLVLLAALLGRYLPALVRPPEPTVQTTLTLLAREELLFLVTDKVTTQIVISQRENSLLLGQREGHLIVTAKMYYGVDLKKVGPNDISIQPDRIVVTIPAPALLDFSIDPERQFLSKRSGTMALADWLYGADLEAELRRQVKAKALEFAQSHALIPDPASILRRANTLLTSLAPPPAKPIEFRYPD